MASMLAGAIISSLIRDIVLFIPLICALPVAMGIEGILWAAPIADGVAMTVAVGLTVGYFVGNKKTKTAPRESAESDAPQPVNS